MRTFEHFPENSICKVCRTNTDKKCILVPIDGTNEGNNCEATPIHVDCINLRYHMESGVLYQSVKSS